MNPIPRTRSERLGPPPFPDCRGHSALPRDRTFLRKGRKNRRIPRIAAFTMSIRAAISELSAGIRNGRESYLARDANYLSEAKATGRVVLSCAPAFGKPSRCS